MRRRLNELVHRPNWASLGLRAQVIVSGFVVMALELLGGRLVATSFGNSIFAWGSLIGVVLSGLAIGYYLGGMLADRSPSAEKFSAIIFTGGLLVLLVPFISPVALAVSFSLQSGELGSRLGPLLASVLILGLPSTVLGMVSPYALKIATQSLARIGRVSGNLYSLSTLGSIVGAFSAAFVLIPLFDLRSILFGMGLALMAVAMVWLPRLAKVLTLIAVLIVATPISGPLSYAAVYSGSIVYQDETPYSHLDVVDQGSRRILYLNGLPHSGMDLTDPNRLVFAYTTYFHLGVLANPDIESVLFVGGGGFSGPKNFLSTYPDISVDVVEVDPDVIDVAQRYFSVHPGPRLAIINEDARIYLTRTEKLYDLIVLDAYAKTYVPFHLMTTEFMQILHSRLTPRGVAVSNLIGSLSGDTSDLVRAEYKTITLIIPNIATFTTSGFVGSVQNIMLVFAKPASPSLIQFFGSEPSTANIPVPPDYRSHMYQGPLQTDDVPVLTDGYAPVEDLLNPVTGQPYIIEQQFGRVVPVVPSVQGSGAVAFLGIVLVGVSWLVYVSDRRLR
jgi:spermidine synthase